MKNLKKLICVVLSVVLLGGLVLTGCTAAPTTSASPSAPATSAAPSTSASASAATTSTAKETTLKVGMVMPMTGGNAFTGEETTNAWKLVLEEAQKDPSWPAGLKIELLLEDDRGVPADAVTAATKLVERDGVQMILGPFTSAETAAMTDYTEKVKIPSISGGAAADYLTTRGYKNYFRVTGSNKMQAYDIPRWLVKKHGWQKIIIANQQTDWGKGLLDVSLATLKDLGVTPVATYTYELNTADFYSLLTKIKGQTYDGILLAANGDELANFVKQAKEVGISCDKIYGYGTDARKLLELLGDIANGYMSNQVIDTVTPKDPAGQHFIASYKAKYNRDASMYAAQGWMVGQVFIQALKEAKTYDAEGIRNALDNVKDVETIGGKVTFDDTNEIWVRQMIQQIQNGKIINIDEASKAD